MGKWNFLLTCFLGWDWKYMYSVAYRSCLFIWCTCMWVEMLLLDLIGRPLIVKYIKVIGIHTRSVFSLHTTWSQSIWPHAFPDYNDSLHSIILILKLWHWWIMRKLTLRGNIWLPAFKFEDWEQKICCFICYNETQKLRGLCRWFCFCHFTVLQKGNRLLEDRCIMVVP